MRAQNGTHPVTIYDDTKYNDTKTISKHMTKQNATTECKDHINPYEDKRWDPSMQDDTKWDSIVKEAYQNK